MTGDWGITAYLSLSNSERAVGKETRPLEEKLVHKVYRVLRRLITYADQELKGNLVGESQKPHMQQKLSRNQGDNQDDGDLVLGTCRRGQVQVAPSANS